MGNITTAKGRVSVFLMKLSSDQIRCLSALEKCNHLAVFGKAGTGKTALRQAIAAKYRCVILGPTGASVAGVPGASTVARFMGATRSTLGDPGALARNMKVSPAVQGSILLIDEISMVSAFDFVALNAGLQRCLRKSAPFGGLRVVLLGDLFQLRPPDVSNTGRLFFETAAYLDLVKDGLRVCELSTQHRQQNDVALQRFLDDARRCSLGAEANALLMGRLNKAKQDSNAVHLFARAKDAAAHNERKLQESVQRIQTFVGFRHTLGAPVFVTENCYKHGRLVYANGAQGTIEASSKAGLSVRINGKLHHVAASKGKVPLALGWATTIHKAQGQTLPAVVVHGGNMFEAGQAYVGVSRATSLEGLATRNLHADDFSQAFPKALRAFAAQHNLK